MHYTYQPTGVCARKIDFDINDGVVSNVRFVGGCNGNLKAIGTLIEGMTSDEIISKLAGNTCGNRSTSCADQLTRALTEAVESAS